VVLTEKRGHKKHAPVFQQHTLVLVLENDRSFLHKIKYRGATKRWHRGEFGNIVTVRTFFTHFKVKEKI